MRSCRAKRSLTISSVGMRPRTMRISLLKSYWRASPGAGAGSVLTAPASTPFSSASISSWFRTSWAMGRASLHHERGEVQRFDLAGLAAHLLDDRARGLEAPRAQRLLAFGGRDARVGLAAEDQQQVVAQARIVFLDELFGLDIARHDLRGDLEEAHGGLGFEVDDERRIERDVARRELLLLLDPGLRFLAALVVVLAGEREVRARATA